MANAIMLPNASEKLANARKFCPNLNPEVYMFAAYMAEYVEESLSPFTLAAYYACTIDDINCGKCDFSYATSNKLPDYIVENKEQILMQARYFSHIVDAIAEAQFAEKFRELLVQFYNMNLSKKVQFVKDEAVLQPYVKAAVDWWENYCINANTVVKVSKANLLIFKNQLGEKVMTALEGYKSVPLEVDTDPCGLLKEAAEQADIDTIKFSRKTNMRVSKAKVTVFDDTGLQILWTA